MGIMHMYCSLNGNRELESTASSATCTWPSSSGLSTSGPTDSAANDDSSGSEDSEAGVNVVYTPIEQLRSPRPSDFARKFMIRYKKKISY